MKLYFIVFKAALFMLCAVMFLPLSVFIGAIEYEEGVHNAMSKFIKEIYEGGYITKEMKDELDNDLAGF